MNRSLLLGTLLLAACSNTTAPGDPYQRGVKALEGGDARTARVEFLNLLKAQPDNKAARIMQARTHIALGDGVAAEAEIKRARALGVPANLTRPLFAHALLLQGRTDEALAQLEGTSGAYAERIRGLVLAATGKSDEAAAAFARALALAPKDSLLLTDIARFRRVNGELAGALRAADQAVAANPLNGEAIMLRGELTRSQYGLRAALPWFDRAIELDGKNVTARLERAATLGDMGAMKAMLSETRRVLYLSPDNAMAYYLQAMLAARARNYPLARSLFQRTSGRLDEQPAAMLLAAAIADQTGDPAQAINRLSHLVDIQPDNDKARRLLAAVKWRAGDTAGTIETLRPLANRPDADGYSLNLMGNALAKLGDGAAASVYLTRAANPGGKAASALLALPSDPAALRDEASSRPGDAKAQIDLIRALLAQGLGGEALSRARALQAANPDAPDASVLVGDALGIQGQFGAAAEQYRRAANIAFTEPTAMRMIEALQRSGQGDAAGKVLSLFLQQNPNSVAAQLLSASRYLEAGEWSPAIASYERLRRQLGDTDAVMLNNLAWAYSEQGDYARGLPIARKAWLLDPDNPATTDTLGWLLFKSGTDKARGLTLLQRAAEGLRGSSRGQVALRTAQGSGSKPPLP